MNQVNLLGVCVSEPHQTQHSDKPNPTVFDLLVTEYYQGKKPKQLIPCKAWGVIGQRIIEHIQKGSTLIVEGRLTPGKIHNPEKHDRAIMTCEVTISRFIRVNEPALLRSDCPTDNL